MCGCGQRTRVVKGEPLRYLYAHNKRLAIEYIVQDCGYQTPCWVWQGKLNDGGYGRKHENGRLQRAHRVYYERFVGPIPAGLQIDHLCRNRACVNPDHLEPVTHAENGRRGKSARLTHGQVARIKRLLLDGVKQADIARQFSLPNRNVISYIASGHNWSDIEPEQL